MPLTPIIYVHRGYSWYLPIALRNGLNHHPGQVHLLGDPVGLSIARLLGARGHRIEDHMAGAGEFQKIYRHHSSRGL